MTTNKGWGTGMWISLHLLAAWADTPDKIPIVCSQIRYICSRLPCPECVEHAKRYIMLNPPEKADDIFVYTWRFHNNVNARLGKPQLPYEKARDAYLNGRTPRCTGGCGGGLGKVQPKLISY